VSAARTSSGVATRVDVYDALTGLPAPLERAWRFPQCAAFFLSLDWFECLFETALTGSLAPRIYVVADQAGAPIAALVCGVPADARRLVSLSNFYTIEFGVIEFRPGPDIDAAVGQIVACIAGERPRWTGVDLCCMRSGPASTMAIAHALAAAGFDSQTSVQYENWYLQTQGRTFDAYFSSRSKKLKKTIPYMVRKITRTDTLEHRIHLDTGPALEQAIREYVSVYDRSWKVSEPFPAFTPALIRLCARHGILRLGILTLNGAAVAAQLWVVFGGRAVIYKIAYDEAFKKLSVGSILSREMFRRAFDQDRVAEIDYGVGGDSYKKDWMEAERDLMRIEAPNAATFKGRADVGYRALKGFAKRVLGRDSAHLAELSDRDSERDK